MNNTNYTIKQANNKQIDAISETYWKPAPKWQEKRFSFHTYVAVDDAGEMLGYLALDEKDFTIPSYGKDWFIVTIVVFSKYRRRGIGTALLDYAFAEAKKEGVLHLQGSANPTKEAQGFWSRNGFVFLKFGSARQDPSKPKEFGNHTHLIFRRVDPGGFSALFDGLKPQTDRLVRIVDASPEEIARVAEEHIAKACTAYVYGKKDVCRVFLAQNDCGETLGFLMYFDEMMASPLSGKNRILGYVYVNESERGCGIAKILLRELLMRAKEDLVDQIVDVHPDESIMPFFGMLGFDIFVTRYLMNSLPNGKYAVGIGKRMSGGSLVLP